MAGVGGMVEGLCVSENEKEQPEWRVESGVFSSREADSRQWEMWPSVP